MKSSSDKEVFSNVLEENLKRRKKDNESEAFSKTEKQNSITTH